MRTIDIQTWNRRQHFEFFRQLDNPYFSLTANVDITRFYSWIKERNLPFFLSVLHSAMKVANEIPEFRYRIRGEGVVEHETVHPSFTLMTDEGVFTFLTAPWKERLADFVDSAAPLVEAAKKRAHLDPDKEREDLVYLTSIPWVSFTAVTHPVHLASGDSIPRIAWGKFFEQDGKRLLPFNVQAHHALMDGEHLGRFFTRLQELLDRPEA
jgi:chloramphenicol O-acetyltransferase type A